jgi:hypothetical protein
MPRRARFLSTALLAAVGFAALHAPTSAQDKKDDKQEVAKQKATVVANLKKAGLGKVAVAESKHFIVATTLPEQKAKVLGTMLDKLVPVARKALQYEEKDEVWKGKLAVYYLPDNRDFKGYVRTVLVMQPEGVIYEVRADEPFVVDPVDVPANATEAEQLANSAAVVAGAFLKAKGSTATLPDWLVGGFGRVTALRAEGVNSTRYQKYKSAAKTAARSAKITELWSEEKPANADIVANSFAEYLAYGPGSANFVKLIYGYRPDANGNPPTPQLAFEAAGWKDLAMLEAAWRKWATTGK